MSVSLNSIVRFQILLSKLGNGKFNSTGICNEGAGLVAVFEQTSQFKISKG